MSRLKRLNHEMRETGWTLGPDSTMVVSEQVKFTIPEYYPFKPPTLWVHGLPHEHYLKLQYNQRLSLIQLRKYTLPCICCSTLLCSWNPCYQCKDLYKEYTDYQQSLYYVDGLELFFFKLDACIIEQISTFLL